MKHLKEGLIKQRGITQFYNFKEISNPTYEDICKLGNVVILHDEGRLMPFVVLLKFRHINKNKPIMVQFKPNNPSRFGFWRTESFESKFPHHIDLKWNTWIDKVFETNINPDSIKTIEDLERVLKPFEIYCKQ